MERAQFNMNSFEIDGFEIIPGVLSDSACQEILARIVEIQNTGAGTRGMLDFAWCRELAVRLRSNPEIAWRLPDTAVAVQCTLFDKSDARNWLVSYHQDLSIPVKERLAIPECSGWSEKEGGYFVQPPDTVLRQLVAVRIHLDSSDPENGPLRVLPGSHMAGRLAVADMEKCRSGVEEIACIAPRGSALLLRPLLLHASSKARNSQPRRVLHFLFGPQRLPFGLEWQVAV
ncbi:MAG: phytanoyl-CoA dioxygenase family protein [Pseudomonadota bacterium]